MPPSRYDDGAALALAAIGATTAGAYLTRGQTLRALGVSAAAGWFLLRGAQQAPDQFGAGKKRMKRIGVVPDPAWARAGRVRQPSSTWGIGCIEYVDYHRIYRPELPPGETWSEFYGMQLHSMDIKPEHGFRIVVENDPSQSRRPAWASKTKPGAPPRGFSGALQWEICEDILDEAIIEDAAKRNMTPRELKTQFYERAFRYGLPSAKMKAQLNRKKGAMPLRGEVMASTGSIPAAVVAESRRINKSTRTV